VGYFHGFLDGVDYVFVDHPAYHHVASDIYAGSRTDILFRCALLCKVCNSCCFSVCTSSPAAPFSVLGRTTPLHRKQCIVLPS
jgi:hypothetical protein